MIMDYFCYFLTDGRLAPKAATFLTFYSFIWCSLFMQDLSFITRVDVACGLAISAVFN